MLAFNIKFLYLIRKEQCAMICLNLGIMLAFFGSIHPWILWPLKELYVIPASLLIVASVLFSNSMKKPVYTRHDFFIALITYIFVSYYMLLTSQANINGMIINLFNIIIMYGLLRLEPDRLKQISTFLAKAFACILIFSIPWFILYILGYPLPSTNISYGDDALYTYSNYYFFLLDDRFLTSIIPRFSSIFLEPGHLGTASVLLLMSQCGNWKKWYNITLIAATILSFSLAAYVFLVVIIILNSWMKKEHIFLKIICFTLLLGCITAGAFLYNNGENMLHDLILVRLEIEDGEMAGDNRVTDDFKKEFENYLDSSDIMFGREMDTKSSGNSGYRVFLYEYGFIGFILIIIFYSSWMAHARYKRALISALIMAVLLFIVRGYMLWFSFFIPIFATTFLPEPGKETIKDRKQV